MQEASNGYLEVQEANNGYLEVKRQAVGISGGEEASGGYLEVQEASSGYAGQQKVLLSRPSACMHGFIPDSCFHTYTPL